MKINLFSFSGPLHNARYLQKKLTELTGKKVNSKESSLKLSETEEIDSGEIRLTIPARLLQPVTDLILSMEDNGKTERNLSKEYKETGYFNLPIIHHRSVVCAPPCQSGYIMVRGNCICRCYDCKGTGYVMPQVGSYELRKIDKKEI